MILCDTNILIEFYKDNSNITAALKEIGLLNLAVSVITVGELYFGALNKKELKDIGNNLALLHQIPLTRNISLRFLGLMESFALSHKPSIPDLLIAASAIEYDLSLFTLNVKDFHFIPNLTIHQLNTQ